MKKLKRLLLIIMIAVVFFGCLNNKSVGFAETEDGCKKSDTETADPLLNNVNVGPYVLDVVLLDGPPWNYHIRIRDSSTDNIIAETRARLTARPLSYYVDEDYFVVIAASEQGETDGLGDPAIMTFLVFDISEKRFMRYGVGNPEIMSFRVIKNKLYVGNHLMESERGSVTVIDLVTGETTRVFTVKAGNESRPIKTWAPAIGLNAQGDVVVQIDEDETKLYRIENDYLVFAEEGSVEEFENPDLPIR
jgi:hypothetical protein